MSCIQFRGREADAQPPRPIQGQSSTSVFAETRDQNMPYLGLQRVWWVTRACAEPLQAHWEVTLEGAVASSQQLEAHGSLEELTEVEASSARVCQLAIVA